MPAPDMEIPKPFSTTKEYLEVYRDAHSVIDEDELDAVGPLWNTEAEARQQCTLLNDTVARGWHAHVALVNMKSHEGEEPRAFPEET